MRFLSVVGWSFVSLLVAIGMSFFASADAHAREPITVFAAASLKEALDAQVSAFEKQSGTRVRVSYAGSNALAKQIENGAPASVFISADEAWMDHLATRKLIVSDTRRNLLSNELVLIAPTANTSIDAAIDLSASTARTALQRTLGEGRIAMADPRTVPAGKYAQSAFEKLGLWDTVEKRIARTDNVRSALAFVARGEAPLGVVYRTDALAEPRVRIVARFPATSHPSIMYPAAVVAANDSRDARALLEYLASDAAQVVWQKLGFITTVPR